MNSPSTYLLPKLPVQEDLIPWSRQLVHELDRYLALLHDDIGSIVAGVSSFNGRVGAVVPLVGDYSAFYLQIGAAAGGDLSGTYPNPSVVDDSHAHVIGTSVSGSHTALTNIGTNTHAAIDTHIADATIHYTLDTDLSEIAALANVRGDLLVTTAGPVWNRLAVGTSGQYLGSDGTDPSWAAPGALTKVDDTNVTLTLGGTPTTALLRAASLTLGWTGQLAASRGGTGVSSINALAALIDHGLLAGLPDDDHTQYALLVGRSGGQTLRGGTGSGDDLLLRSTSHATRGQIRLADEQEWYEDITAFGTSEVKRAARLNISATISPTGLFERRDLIGLDLTPTVTSAAGAASIAGVTGLGFGGSITGAACMAIGAVVANPTVTNTAASGTFGAFQLFNAAPVLVSATASVAPYGPYILVAGSTVRFNGTGTATLAAASTVPAGTTPSAAVLDLTTLQNQNAGGTFNAAHATVEHKPAVTETAGTMTVSALHALRVRAPTVTGSPAITEHIAVDVEDLDVGGVTTLACSLRSASDTVQLRHEGPVYLGDDVTAPDTILHLASSGAFHGSATFQETSANPTAPGAVDRCRVYMKADKLVVQVYNAAAAAVRYFWLDLTATSNQSWIFSTSAP